MLLSQRRYTVDPAVYLFNYFQFSSVQRASRTSRSTSRASSSSPNDIDAWPKRRNGAVLEALTFDHFERVTFTSSSGEGLLDGQGRAWWGLPGIGYLQRQENRPRLFVMGQGKDLVVENITFRDPAYWTFWAHGVDGLVVRYSSISARRGRRGRRGPAHPGRPRTAVSLNSSEGEGDDSHTLMELTAFNTDGFDVSGRNVHIHDCDIWTQDDTIAVKDDSQNMLFERITASGVGLTDWFHWLVTRKEHHLQGLPYAQHRQGHLHEVPWRRWDHPICHLREHRD